MRVTKRRRHVTHALLVALAGCAGPSFGADAGGDAATADASSDVDARVSDASASEDAGAPADGAAVSDGSVELDGGLADAARPPPFTESGAFDPATCSTCVVDRCDAAAVECLEASECRAVVICRRDCTSLGCLDACTPARWAEPARALEECVYGRPPRACLWPCAAADPAFVSDGICQEAGSPCDPLVIEIATCCEGVCPDRGGTCGCVASGMSCSSDAQCCDLAAGAFCDAGTCRLPTCVERPSACDGSLPCCDPNLRCDFSSPGVQECCAPDGTDVTEYTDSVCCSNAVMTSDTGRLTCVAAP